MHGLINRAIECFVTDAYSRETWIAVSEAAGLGFESFEALLHYDAAVTERVLSAAADTLEMPPEMVLEDLGTYLVSAPAMQPVRRLLRLSGESYIDFLFSIDDLRDRARFALADLDLPILEMRDHSARMFTLSVYDDWLGFSYVLLGVMRAMADDYGVLALINHTGTRARVATLSIELVKTDYAQARDFELAVT